MWKLCVSGCVLLAAAGIVQARPFTATDLARLERVSDPHVSPDGRFLAFNVRSTDWEGNRGFNAVWVLERRAGAAPRLIRDQEKSPTAPRWSADGHWLYFLSSRSGSTQLWRAAATEAQSQQVTSLPLDIAYYRLARDAHSLVVAVNVHPDCDTLSCSKAKDDAKAKEKSTGVIYDTTTTRFWDTYLDGHFIGLFAVGLQDDKPPTDGVALTRGYQADIVARPEGDDSSFLITHDGSTVIFAAIPSGAAQGVGMPSSLYSVPFDAGSPPKRLDSHSATSDDGLAQSPDGARVVYLSRQGSVFTAPRARIMLRDLRSGTTRELAPTFDRSPTALAWSSDSKTVYAAADDVGQTRLFAIDAGSGAAKALTQDGHVMGVDAARDVIVYTRDALDSPAQVFEIAGGAAPHALTHVGAEALAQAPFSAFEQFAF